MYSHWNDIDYGLILRALCTNPSLEQFELRWRKHDPPLGTLDHIARALCDVLVANTTLQRLRLCGIPAVALSGVFDQLLAGLMVNRTLRDVAVGPLVPVRTESSSLVAPPRYWDRVVELLEHNAVIRTFHGFGASATTTRDPANATATVRASFLLELNSHGRRALMPGGDIPNGCWPVVLGRIASGDGGSDSDPPSAETTAAQPAAVLYHFLRAKPELIRTSVEPRKRARNGDFHRRPAQLVGASPFRPASTARAELSSGEAI